MSKLLFGSESLNDEYLKKLKNLDGCLTRWNSNINITSSTDQNHIWDRHILDCLQLIPFFTDVNKMADMGSGIGFPAIPVAIAKPDIDVFAIEASQKKTSLMNELVREVRIPNIHVLNERVERVLLSHMDIVCSRAFGEFTRDARLAYRMLKPGGLFITFKTARQQVVPQGYERVNNHEYMLPGNPKSYFIVIAEKAGEM